MFSLLEDVVIAHFDVIYHSLDENLTLAFRQGTVVNHVVSSMGCAPKNLPSCIRDHGWNLALAHLIYNLVTLRRYHLLPFVDAGDDVCEYRST